VPATPSRLAPQADLEQALAAALSQRERVHFPALPGRTNHMAAGVLVPLLLSEQGARGTRPRAEVILQQRPTSMREHPGEISLPGGRHEDGDADLTTTALREAHEELGIDRPRVLGLLSSYPLYTSDYRLHPTVAVLADDAFVPNPAEVAAVLRLDLYRALELPFIQGIPWDLGGERYVCPVFDVGAPRLVFGGTAQVLYDMLEVFAASVGAPVPETRAGKLTWADVLR
jgi:8-oxo-dGTP pyrophosphatase MutT (NUDIX family)